MHLRDAASANPPVGTLSLRRISASARNGPLVASGTERPQRTQCQPLHAGHPQRTPTDVRRPRLLARNMLSRVP